MLYCQLTTTAPHLVPLTVSSSATPRLQPNTHTLVALSASLLLSLTHPLCISRLTLTPSVHCRPPPPHILRHALFCRLATSCVPAAGCFELPVALLRPRRLAHNALDTICAPITCVNFTYSPWAAAECRVIADARFSSCRPLCFLLPSACQLSLTDRALVLLCASIGRVGSSYSDSTGRRGVRCGSVSGLHDRVRP